MSCCHEPSNNVDQDALIAKIIMKKSVLALVIGAIYFLGGMLHVLPALTSYVGHYFWLVSIIVVAAVMMYCGQDFFKGAWSAFWDHNANMDTLVSIGTLTAWLYSSIVIVFYHSIPKQAQGVYFDTACLVIGFVLLGAALESRARRNTNAAIKQLMALAPETAMVVREGEDVWLNVADIVVGDVVRLRPGDKVPVDGCVIGGDSYIDESMLTGEPIPVKKVTGDHVSAGTINQKGALLYRVERIGSDTVLAHIIDTVQKAQRSKPEIARLTDKIASVFAPFVMIVALVTAFIWLNFSTPPVEAHVLMAAIAVLLVACPCALGLATPISVMIAVGKAANAGIIIRNGEALQTAKSLSMVVLDKTGTITEGRARVTDEKVFVEGDGAFLSALLALEQQSEHPLAQAVSAYLKEKNIEPAVLHDFVSVSGMGVEAYVDGHLVAVGNDKMLAKHNVSAPDAMDVINEWAQDAKTPIFFMVDNQCVLALAIADPIKEGVAKSIARLKGLNLRVLLLTGDNGKTAQAVAKRVGIAQDDVFADVMPQDKDQLIDEHVHSGKVVAMVGDGINDAAALSRAHVGFAIGAGSDIAIDSADMVLMGDSLNGVVKAIKLSRTTMSNIKQNLFGAFIYNIVALPIAAGVLYPFFGIMLSPIIAGVAMALSSLTVVLNANRLRLIDMTRD